uniref:Aminoglycoside phosphotransferase domain-containing protein n=1 Tax=Ganoderma boninense TaxID=34458 RepID=A0A5K1K4K6_9APHY|nr:Uncharacterized protein [Ganoderma boninense]
MFHPAPPERVSIAVYAVVTRRTKNNRVHRCPQDGRLLVLDVQLGAALESKASVALVLLDAQNPQDLSRTTVDVARTAAASTCVVHTKVDLLPSDHSPDHLYYLGSIPYLAFVFDIDCLPVSLTTGKGVDGVLSFIAQSVTGSAPPSPFKWRTALFPFHRLWSYLLDCIAACFALPPPAPLPDLTAELAPLTSDSIVKQLERVPTYAAWGEELKRRLRAEDALYLPVTRISPSLLVKSPRGSERASMAFVREHTTIPIPRDLCPGLRYLVMDFIDGEMLYECWDRLSRLMQFRVACTLRLYTKQLRAFTRATPGAVDSTRVRGIVFNDYVYGPFSSMRAFRQFCEEVVFQGWSPVVERAVRAKEAFPPCPRVDLSQTPVLTHGDLNSSNIMLDRQGCLWVLDWATAGFYPPSMEAVAMQRVDAFHYENESPASWLRYRPFIAGHVSEEEEAFWHYFSSGTNRRSGDPC